MKYSAAEVMQFVREEDVKFIRLAFCDVYGKQKNVSIMPSELERAFSQGIGFDASAIPGFGGEVYSDLFLHPDPSRIFVLPWRPEHGKVMRMFCDIRRPDGESFACDARSVLKKAVAAAEQAGYSFSFGSEMEFYLFQTDEEGRPTRIPYDMAGYMDIAPDDKGENVRREICLSLERMGIFPESSHHEEGPGQNEIDFRYSDPLTAADNAAIFRMTVQTVAARNGLYADFSPKPLAGQPGSGFHINMSVRDKKGDSCWEGLIAGVMDKIRDMTLFLNPAEASYSRLGGNKAPQYVTWSSENRAQLIRIPAATGEFRRVELRSPDPLANPYLAFALLIYAGLHGMENHVPLPPASDFNPYSKAPEELAGIERLPGSLTEAAELAKASPFIATHLPREIIQTFCRLS